MVMEKGDYFIITKEKEEKFDTFADLVADTHEERIKLLMIDARIASWAKGDKVRDVDKEEKEKVEDKREDEAIA